MARFVKISAASLLAGAALVSMAQAGGYSRGSANLDPLLEEGTFFAASMAVTAPSRGVATINGTATTAATGGDFASTYESFAATGAVDLFAGVRCAGSFAQPYGADANYGNSRILMGYSTTQSNSLKSTELGLTCAYGFDAGPGKVHLIGGVFHQSLDYNEIRGAIVAPGPVILNNAASINMSDAAMGFRLGAAYTIPEIALKASLVYRSSVDHRMEGQQFIAVGPAAGTYNIFAEAELPQSLKLSLQSGIAPGWLAFGSVEWTDWSVLQRVAVNCAQAYGPLCAAGAPSPGAPSVDAYFGDGWTVTAGVGHKFNDLFSGSFSVTWDKGVSNAFAGAKRSSFSDTWTFAVGGAFTPNENASIRAGLAYSMLSSASETNASNTTTLGYSSDYAISGGVSASVKF